MKFRKNKKSKENKIITTKSTRTKRIEEGKTSSFFSRLSKGLLIPVAVLPIAGIFMGIGSAISSLLAQSGVVEGSVGYIFADIFTLIGSSYLSHLGIWFGLSIAITFTNDAGMSALATMVSYMAYLTISTIFISDPYVGTSGDEVDILFWEGLNEALVDRAYLGFTSLRTGVLAGMLCGTMVAVLYNKFYKIKLPEALGFFGGVRFVPIISLVAVVPLTFMLLIFWPIVGTSLTYVGIGIATIPGGFGSFLYGFFERLLLPIGMHHVLNSVIRYTEAGGTMFIYEVGTTIEVANAIGNENIYLLLVEYQIPFTQFNDIQDLQSGLVPPSSGNWAGGTITALDGTQYDIIFTEGVVPGMTRNGKAPSMMIALPLAGLAMIMAAPKGPGRILASSVIGAAMFTAFLTGVTEPLEYSFLFVSPMLYFFHALLFGLGFWISDLLNITIGMGTGGVIDFAIHGILPQVSGMGTNFYFVFLVGAITGSLYFVIFYSYIRYRNLDTPGRGSNISLTTKSGLKNKNTKTSEKTVDLKRKERVQELITGLGGLDNLKTIDACITRLRLTLVDRSKLDEKTMKDLGAKAVVGKSISVQIIFGAEADIFKSELNDLKKAK